MTWFDDLLERAMPYLWTEELAGSQGASWQWSYPIPTATGLASGYTATAVLKAALSDASSTVSVSCTFPASDTVRCTVTPGDSSGLTAGRYFHEVEITRTSDGASLKVVGAGESFFVVKPGAYTTSSGITAVDEDTDGVPYFDAAATGTTVLEDTDGVWYVDTSGTSLPVLADTDGVPYVDA